MSSRSTTRDSRVSDPLASTASLLIRSVLPGSIESMAITCPSRRSPPARSSRGATVVATGTAEDAERLVDLGASLVIDYTSGPVAEQVRTSYPDGVDALIDLVSYTPDAVPLAAVHKGGKVASSMGAAHDETLAGAGLTGSNIMAGPVREVVASLAAEAAAGTLRVHVATRLPLEQATDGLATIAEGQAHGKIVVTIAD